MTTETTKTIDFKIRVIPDDADPKPHLGVLEIRKSEAGWGAGGYALQKHLLIEQADHFLIQHPAIAEAVRDIYLSVGPIFEGTPMFDFVELPDAIPVEMDSAVRFWARALSS